MNKFLVIYRTGQLGNGPWVVDDGDKPDGMSIFEAIAFKDAVGRGQVISVASLRGLHNEATEYFAKEMAKSS